jgi:uncharacterized LabA/DUF88 family protein
MPLKTTVYVDGFNLYYRALRGTPFKWLNLRRLCSLVLGQSYEVVEIKYYTARVSGALDPKQPARQHAYLRALATLPEVSIHYGKFLAGSTWLPLVTAGPNDERYALVRRNEEKGSDVSLATHLVHDAHRRAFDAAAVVSCDTDLVEPVRVVTREIGLPVCVIPTKTRMSTSLKEVATAVRYLTHNRLRRSQFPNPVLGRKGPIRKPPTW